MVVRLARCWAVLGRSFEKIESCSEKNRWGQKCCRKPARDVALCQHIGKLRAWHGCCAPIETTKTVEISFAMGVCANPSFVIFSNRGFRLWDSGRRIQIPITA